MKYKIGIGVLLLGALGVLTFFAYIRIKEISATISEAESKIINLEQKEREFALAESSLKDFGGEINLLYGAFVSENAFVDFLRLLEKLSRKAGVKFSAQSARLPVSGKELASLNFEISGSFQSVANFFALLDKIPYAGISESVNISPKIEPGQKRTGEITAKINYVIFNFTP